MTNTKELRRLAEVAKAEPSWPFHVNAFHRAASPSVVLALLDEIEALRKDAGRYRWLRDGSDSRHGVYDVFGKREDVNFIQFTALKVPLGTHDTDAAIDAAMAPVASPQPEKETP